jgi:hypothetical protein
LSTTFFRSKELFRFPSSQGASARQYCSVVAKALSGSAQACAFRCGLSDAKCRPNAASQRRQPPRLTMIGLAG